MKILAAILAALAIASVALMLFKYFAATRRAAAVAHRPAASGRFPLHRCTRRDAVIAALITLVYALVGFSNLGDSAAPQSFFRLTSASPTLTVDLGRTYTLAGINYYTGSFHDVYGNYKGYDLEFSIDGETCRPYGILEQTHANTFHWVERSFTAEDVTTYGAPSARYVRLTAHTFPLELGELTFIDGDTNAPIDASDFMTSPVDAKFSVFDEQSLMPDEPSYRNSMYFDEIYHARTAREFINGDKVYETTHPPLGKSIISLGVMLFGMTPFGWRFMGVLFGVLMLPFTYVFIKNMFGKTWLAACGTLIFAFDFMHYVQTRIATIDTYGLFFTILMYFFMYRFLAAGYDAPASRRLVPLALCGISFGLGIASKWTCFYAAAGLVVLYIIGAVTEGRRLYAEDRRAEFWRKLAGVIAVSVVFFVVVGFGIYYLSYIPFCRSKGQELSFANVWANQTSMFDYHSKLVASHAYQSSWWQWLIDGRPILYFRNSGSGQTASFAAFNSPLTAWAGLGAMVALFGSFYRDCPRSAKRTGLVFTALVLAGYAAQIVTFIASGQEDFTNQPFSYLFALGMLGVFVTPFIARFLTRRSMSRSRSYGFDEVTDDEYDAILDARRRAIDIPAPGEPVAAPASNPGDPSDEPEATSVAHSGDTSADGRSLLIVIGFMAQLIAWIAVTRCTFAYHYFPASFFLVLALAAMFDRWDEISPAPAPLSRRLKPSRFAALWRGGSSARRICLLFTAACLLLFLMYYPTLTGLYAPNWYRSLLRWFPSWPI